MANRKRNIAYIKPEDPKFLRLLKEQVGYDDRNPKFDDLRNEPHDFVDDEDSEKPQVVVLKDGDLTAEEAEKAQIEIETAAENAKADLSQKVVFSAGKRKGNENADLTKDPNKTKKQKKREDKAKPLSFDFNDEDSEES